MNARLCGAHVVMSSSNGNHVVMHNNMIAQIMQRQCCHVLYSNEALMLSFRALMVPYIMSIISCAYDMIDISAQPHFFTLFLNEILFDGYPNQT